MNVAKEKETKTVKTGKRALRGFHIFHPPQADIKIQAGDDLSDIPALYHQNLITEGVMKG